MSSPALPLLSWTTDTVPPAQRFDYWVGAVCEAFLELGASASHPESFAGTLQSVPGEEIVYSRVAADAQDVFRTRAAIARSSEAPFYLLTQLEHSWSARQGGQTLHLRPGDTVLLDASLPTELRFPVRCACAALRLSPSWLGKWLDQLRTGSLRVAWRDVAWGYALSALCQQLARDLRSLEAIDAGALSDNLGSLLAASLEPDVRAQWQLPRSLVARAEAVLRESCTEPGLTAAAVADRLGTSVRSLHRAFTGSGRTFAGTLKSLRIEHATALLARRPAGAPLRIAEVAARSGFTDPSHFIRAFATAHGVTPAAFRRHRGGSEAAR
jgi:AraC-like DNA-binding protein